MTAAARPAPFPEGEPGKDPAGWAWRIVRAWRRETRGMDAAAAGRYAHASFDALAAGACGVTAFADAVRREAVFSGILSNAHRVQRHRIARALAMLAKQRTGKAVRP